MIIRQNHGTWESWWEQTSPTTKELHRYYGPAHNSKNWFIHGSAIKSKGLIK